MQIKGVELSWENGPCLSGWRTKPRPRQCINSCTLITERSVVPVVQRNVLFGLVGCFGGSVEPVCSESMSGTSSLEKYANWITVLFSCHLCVGGICSTQIKEKTKQLWHGRNSRFGVKETGRWKQHFDFLVLCGSVGLSRDCIGAEEGHTVVCKRKKS